MNQENSTKDLLRHLDEISQIQNKMMKRLWNVVYITLVTFFITGGVLGFLLAKVIK